MKVRLFDIRLIRNFFEKIVSVFATVCTVVFIFLDIPDQHKLTSGLSTLAVFIVLYLLSWIYSNRLKKVNLTVEGSKVSVKTGDIFEQPGFKAVAFNEFFDTKVDNNIISENSLNGIFINDHFSGTIEELNAHIENYSFDDGSVLELGIDRNGKSTRYKLGSTCVLDDYLLTAFSKFDSSNKANLTMPEYLEFLINFWDNVNRVYSQKSVSVPIFGSGITRIKEHKNISDEDLLKIMLWTFRISEMRFKYPAMLSIIIHKDKINSINLLDIKEAQNGI